MTRRAELLVSGRIVTLAGEDGLGIVEAIAIGDGRVLAAGRSAEVESLVGAATRRIALAPDEIAIPGISDAHIHLADAAMAAQQVDLAGVATYGDGLAAIATAHAVLADPDAWLEGQGWDAERWGRWPSGADLERIAPGRRVALWAHDHHTSWVSPAALATAGVAATTPDPPGGVIGRDAEGRTTGLLHETAARLVSVHIPGPTSDALAAAIERLARQLVAGGVVAVHDPGGVAPDPDLAGGMVAYRSLAEADRLPLRVHACLRGEALDAAIARGLRSGDPLGPPAGRARVGWMKLFGDGSLGSRTAAMLDPFEAEADRPAPPGGPFGVYVTPPERLAELTARAAAAGIATQIHAIGDGAARAALDALEPTARRLPLVPRIEHVQLLDPDDLPRFDRSGIAASVQPIHLRSDAATARRAWGERAERLGYPWASLAMSGALIPFGTDAPVEPWDPWPGLEIAVTRRSADWGAAATAYGAAEGLELSRALRALCLDAPLSAGEHDRGRLTVGHRADVVVIDAAAIDQPVEPGGPLGQVHPSRVLLDGAIAFEA